MHVSVIVPVYNALALAKECLESIFKAGSVHSFEVIVVDNGSTSDVEDWLLTEEKRHSNLRHLRYSEPLGFARAVNFGAASASGTVLIVLNSDTRVSPGWMDGLCEALEADPSLGALTPGTNQAGEPAQIDLRTAHFPAEQALAFRAPERRAPDILYLPQRVTFFCVALRREVWESLGGLDESYPVGNFEDDELCLRLRVAGYRLGVARHLFVYHHNNATFQENRISNKDWLTQNATLFAACARKCAEALDPAPPRWPRRPAHDVSVVIHGKAGAPLDRTLRSLENQTVEGFEIVLPDSVEAPTRAWIAHIAQGDILYPFHLEALLDALDRSSSEAIFADGWIAGSDTAADHPDASRQSRRAPLLLAGWMHRSWLDPDRLWEQSVPVHWPRLTWEMQEAPAAPLPVPAKEPPVFLDLARRLYRRSVRLDTRLAIKARLQRVLSQRSGSAKDAQLQSLAGQLDTLRADGTDAEKFANGGRLPAVIMLNAIPWHSAVQRQQHFARGLARQGHRVFWVETDLRGPENWWTGRALPQVEPGVHLVRLPGASRDIYHLPWTPATVDAMSAALLLTASAYGLRQVVSLVNYPRWQPLAMRLSERAGWKVVYDCLDDQAAMADTYRTHLGMYEEWLVDGADLVFTSSELLRRRFVRRSPILLHNAADYELFSSCVSAGHLRHLPRPVIGFFGALADWLDMDLIHAAALRFPAWSFVYIGPYSFSGTAMEARWVRGADLRNITVLAQMDPRTLATHLADFDVCIMPFLDIPVTRTMNAVKLYEYLAAGKPTISRDLPEVRHLEQGDLIALYSTPDEFYECLERAVGGNTPELTLRRREFARRNDWSDRVQILSRKIVELVHETSPSKACSSGSNTRSHE